MDIIPGIVNKDLTPIVSVCMVTYNHSQWIGQAIEGVLMQRTTFPFELVVSDDCSTDTTSEIIRKIASDNPSLVRPRFNNTNSGLAKNFSETLNYCRGKYIAICEGDDFWTDPAKLQRQVDFLEKWPDYIMVSHNYCILKEGKKRSDLNEKFHKDFRYNQKLYLNDWATQPVTCLFRNLLQDYTLLNKENNFCDVILFYELLKHGDGYFMNNYMATFRVHQSALSSGLSRWQWLRNHVRMFDYLYKYNNGDRLLLKKSRDYCLSLYIYNLQNKRNENGDFKPLKEYFERAPGFANGLITVMLRVPYYLVRYCLLSRLKVLKTDDQ
jgi:glycosyltransferase involved in cell wall biosynthesis